jgi:hypothetical protein
MLRKLGLALLVVLFSGSTASASPLTFYTDEAAWRALPRGPKRRGSRSISGWPGASARPTN